MTDALDVARIRFHNTMRLFEEFVQATVKSPDAATLRGLERRFAERLLIQPSYWSQIKARSRQIGERLARQFEQRCHKPAGWLDAAQSDVPDLQPAGPDLAAAAAALQAVDEDERFIVGLVLTYYRRHPQRAKTRLLHLLGEVLEPAPAPAASRPTLGAPSAHSQGVAAEAATQAADQALWGQLQRRVAPLKPRR